MRICALILVALYCLVTLSCAARLQPAVTGEWSDVHKDKAKVSMNARAEAEKPAAEK